MLKDFVFFHAMSRMREDLRGTADRCCRNQEISIWAIQFCCSSSSMIIFSSPSSWEQTLKLRRSRLSLSGFRCLFMDIEQNQR